MASFVDVSFSGMAAQTGISSSDSEELWLLWEVDPSASPPHFLASSSSLEEFAVLEPSPSWCLSSSMVPLPSGDVDLLSLWPSSPDPAGDPDAATWELALDAELEWDLTRLVP